MLLVRCGLLNLSRRSFGGSSHGFLYGQGKLSLAFGNPDDHR